MGCRATWAFQSVIIGTLSAVPRGEWGWRGTQPRPLGSQLQPAQQPHVWLRRQTTRRRETAQCLLRRETLYLLASRMVWLRQAASELRRGLEPGGWRHGDWQPRPRTPTGDAGTAEQWLFLEGDCVLCFSVGRPIPVRRTPHPTQEQTDQLHQTYMEELKKLFDEHKGKYGIPEHKTLVFKWLSLFKAQRKTREQCRENKYIK